MSTVAYNPYKNAQEQFDKVAAVLGLDSGTCSFLRQPMYETHFTIPVKMMMDQLKHSKPSVSDTTMLGDQPRAEFAFTPMKQPIPLGHFLCG